MQPNLSLNYQEDYRPEQSYSNALEIERLTDNNELTLLITSTAFSAKRLKEEIAFFAPQKKISLFPDWETLPYDSFSPHQDLISERLETLYQITQNNCDIVIIPVTTILYRLPPTDFLAKYTFFIKKSDPLDTDSLRKQLVHGGYQNVGQVFSPGEYSIRGSVIDLYPMGSILPYRVDLLDLIIDSIRTFDPDTQRSIYKTNEIRLLPAKEFPTDNEARELFRSQFRKKISGDPTKSQIYREISNGITPSGIEYYLPLFFEKTNSFFDYIPSNSKVLVEYDVISSASVFLEDAKKRFRIASTDPLRPPLNVSEIYFSEKNFNQKIESTNNPQVTILKNTNSMEIEQISNIDIEPRKRDPLLKFKNFHKKLKNKTVIVAQSLGRRESLIQMFKDCNIDIDVQKGWNESIASDSNLIITVGPIQKGFYAKKENLIVITEKNFYPDQPNIQLHRKKKQNTENTLKNLAEIETGDLVVHSKHGVAKYLGLQTMDMGEGETEFLTLEYSGADKLYVPVASLHFINRYSSNDYKDSALSKLGTKKWDKSKERALKRIHDTAAELLATYAERAKKKGYAFKVNKRDLEAFSSEFPFQETPDQTVAINSTITDLQSAKPMDRLICGDVGFGKTEIALRAAFIAVADGKQVAVLVPTTLLAEQHFNTFINRFADWPVEIVEISRFRTQKEIEVNLKKLSDGNGNIAIGTHKLLSNKTKFKNLGLIIIDEEHRFGVRQKEKLKSLRTNVDVLTLTATPIPRTLSMSLEGIRDFSIISTAPEKRLSIKTLVAPSSEGIVREAVLRELNRGGQIYFLHNSVDTIEYTHQRLTKLLPEAIIKIAHGQMPERHLENIMRDFYQGRFSVLLCTTIIETGLDIPNANTIIIDQCDRFGLAQLHQLRGRVGRSHHQAYAYLLTTRDKKLSRSAQKRLEAIQSMEELGSGFFLAMHDLELRGAGEVLGDQQSGEIQEIGFHLYSEILDRAVKLLKANEKFAPNNIFEPGIEINLHSAALFPIEYCESVHTRLVLYKRLASCETRNQINLLKEEIIDRFGLLPEPAKTLIRTHIFRILAKSQGITRIDTNSKHLTLHFNQDFVSDPEKILDYINRSENASFSGQDKIRIETIENKVTERLNELEKILIEIGCHDE